jgi:hypothetical protein
MHPWCWELGMATWETCPLCSLVRARTLRRCCTRLVYNSACSFKTWAGRQDTGTQHEQQPPQEEGQAHPPLVVSLVLAQEAQDAQEQVDDVQVDGDGRPDVVVQVDARDEQLRVKYEVEAAASQGAVTKQSGG